MKESITCKVKDFFMEIQLYRLARLERIKSYTRKAYKMDIDQGKRLAAEIIILLYTHMHQWKTKQIRSYQTERLNYRDFGQKARLNFVSFHLVQNLMFKMAQ